MDNEGVISDYKYVIAVLKLMNIKLNHNQIEMLKFCNNEGVTEGNRHLKFKINENSITGIAEKYQHWHTIIYFNRPRN